MAEKCRWHVMVLIPDKPTKDSVYRLEKIDVGHGQLYGSPSVNVLSRLHKLRHSKVTRCRSLRALICQSDDGASLASDFLRNNVRRNTSCHAITAGGRERDVWGGSATATSTDYAPQILESPDDLMRSVRPLPADSLSEQPSAEEAFPQANGGGNDDNAISIQSEIRHSPSYNRSPGGRSMAPLAPPPDLEPFLRLLEAREREDATIGRTDLGPSHLVERGDPRDLSCHVIGLCL